MAGSRNELKAVLLLPNYFAPRRDDAAYTREAENSRVVVPIFLGAKYFGKQQTDLFLLNSEPRRFSILLPNYFAQKDGPGRRERGVKSGGMGY